MKELITRPGAMIRDYIHGKRKTYAHPFRYFIIVLAAYLIVSELIGFDAIRVFSDMVGAKEMPNPDTASTKASNFFRTHINSFLILYAFSLAAYAKLVNLKKKYFYIEYAAAAFFIVGEYLLFLIVIITMASIESWFFLLNYIVVFAYPIYVLTQFQEGRGWVKFMKSTFISIFGWLTYAILGFLISLLIVVVFNL